MYAKGMVTLQMRIKHLMSHPDPYRMHMLIKLHRTNYSSVHLNFTSYCIFFIRLIDVYRRKLLEGVRLLEFDAQKGHLPKLYDDSNYVTLGQNAAGDAKQHKSKTSRDKTAVSKIHSNYHKTQWEMT